MSKTHGLSFHPLYRIWIGIKQRCENKTRKEYNKYGGRGITIFKEWEKDVVPFYNYTSLLPNYDENNIGVKSNNISLDRIDNDGDYEPGNLRWATKHIQAANCRVNKANKSGYKGVRFISIDDAWDCDIIVNGINHRIGRFNNKISAVIARDLFIIEHNLREYNLQIL